MSELSNRRKRIVDDYAFKNHLTNDQMIKKIGVSTSTYYRFLEGHSVSRSSLFLFSKVLNVPARDIQ